MKKLISLFLALIIAFSIICCNTQAASVFMRQKKSIYLVMDDSGSMGGNPTDEANYSLQTLLAMTDKNDTVKLYFLNSNGNGIGKIDMTSKSNKLFEKINKNYPKSSGGTPYEPVLTAQQELRSAAAPGDETDYWLVVFTDGAFSSYDTNNDLRNFAQETLANGTHPNVLYLTVASTNSVNDQGIPNLHSISESSVIEAMNQAASIISSRIKVSDEVYSEGNKKITFNIPYPAKNIVVFTQNNKVKILSSNSSSALNTSENYTVSYPNPKAINNKITDSTVCFITEQNGSSITAGEITLEFDNPVTPKNTTILFEPAIGITVHYYNQDGQEITVNDFMVGENVKVKYSLCDSETKQELPDSLFNGQVKYSSVIDGNTYNTNEFDFKIKNDKLIMELNATLPDGYVLTLYNSLEKLPEKRIVSFTLSNGGNFSCDYDKLESAAPIDGIILINGKSPSPEEFKDFSVKVKGRNIFASNIKIEKDPGNGVIRFTPKKGLIPPLTPKQKSYEIILKDKDGTTYTAILNSEIPGERPWWELVMFIAGLILLIYIIAVIVTRKRFPKGSYFRLYELDAPIYGNEAIPNYYSFRKLKWREFKRLFKGDRSFLKNTLNPRNLLLHQSQRVSLNSIGYQGLTVIADTGTAVLIDDITLTPDEIGGGYTSDYIRCSSNFTTELPFRNLYHLNKKRPFYSISLDQVIVKTDEDDDCYYLQFTDSRN